MTLKQSEKKSVKVRMELEYVLTKPYKLCINRSTNHRNMLTKSSRHLVMIQLEAGGEFGIPIDRHQKCNHDVLK